MWECILAPNPPLVALSDEPTEHPTPKLPPGSPAVLGVWSSHCKWQEALGPQMQSLALKGTVAMLSPPRFLAAFCSDLFLGSDELPTRSALPAETIPGCLVVWVLFFFPTPTRYCCAGGRYSGTSERITSLAALLSHVLFVLL